MTTEETLKQELLNMERNTNQSEEGLGKVETPHDKKLKENDINRKESEGIGFRTMTLDALPSQGKYYPKDCQILFRACNTEEIKYFSSMTENDGGEDLQNKTGYIFDNCIKITWGGSLRSATYLKDADKVCMLFAIRDLTMDVQGNEVKLMQSSTCGNCGKKWKFEITNDLFAYYNLPKSVEKYYSDAERCFYITHEDLIEPIRLYIPSMEVNTKIMNYMRKKERNRVNESHESSYYNPRHLTILSFIVNEPIQLTQERMDNISEEIKTWQQSKWEAVNYAVDKLNINIKPTVSIKCKKSEGGCDESIVTPVIFREGWRHFFDISNIVGKLFQDTE